MLRITETFEDEKTIKLRLDGRITSEFFPHLGEACSRYRKNGEKTIVLDFSGVTYIDDSATRPVVHLRDSGITIVNCSLFIESLLRITEG